MRAALVDTDVVSYLFKRDTRSSLYQPHLKGGLNSISFMTVAELDYWAVAQNWGQQRRNKLAEFLREFTVIDSSRLLCLKWAEVRVLSRRQGRMIQPSDAWIAATALLYEVPLLTHNASDFAWIDALTVISEAQ